MSDSFDLEAPDHFTAGTIGPPGQREFYLQARESAKVVTLKVEKEQVRSLGEYLARLLAPLPAGDAAPADVELLEPIAAAWAVGVLGVGYDEASDRVVVIANELVEEESEEAATARFHLTRGQAAAFVERADALMKAGRPTCPICGQPIDPEGHICPRSNGHAVRA